MNGIKVLIAFVCGFIFAQGIKTVVAILQGKKDISKYLTKSGGMPSGHASSFVAASVCLGMIEGFDSTIFALAICTTIIILYDAMNVRYAVGKQGKALNRLIPEPLRVVEGHTVIEVFVGILIGILVGLVVFFAI